MTLETKLLAELNRYREINRYSKKMIMEQEAPPQDLPPLPEDPAALPPEGEVPLDPAADPAALDPMADPAADPMDVPPMDMDSTEEIDITDLVNMTKSIKKDLEDRKDDTSGVMGKMDSVFTKLTDLEDKLAQMDMLMDRIEQLDSKIEKFKTPNAVEKLEMRSLDSYPFNQKPREFFDQKQTEMRASGKNEYILTKDDVTNYPVETIKDTFNDSNEENEFRF
jgi:hypothetical protein